MKKLARILNVWLLATALIQVTLSSLIDVPFLGVVQPQLLGSYKS